MKSTNWLVIGCNPEFRKQVEQHRLYLAQKAALSRNGTGRRISMAAAVRDLIERGLNTRSEPKIPFGVIGFTEADGTFHPVRRSR